MIVKENTNIVQANFMIENRPKFTKDETRLYLTIIGAVNKEDTDFKPLEIPVSEFAELWGMDSSAAYRKIKTALRGLVQKEFFIEGVNQSTGKMRFLSASYLSMAAYEEGQGYATVEISQAFKPYLIALKEKYTQYVLENIMNLTTVNAIRNYELLKQYESLGVRVFTVEEYKKALNIENKYSLNADLRRYVLEPAAKEINQNTDILIDYEIAGRGKKSKIKFTISQNKKIAELSASELEEIDENQMTIDDVLYDKDNDEARVDHIEISDEQALLDARDRRGKICAGFDDKIFDEFTDEQLAELRSLAGDMIDPNDVFREQSILGDLITAKEVVVSTYIRRKILMCNARGSEVKNRYGFIKGAVAENWR